MRQQFFLLYIVTTNYSYERVIRLLVSLLHWYLGEGVGVCENYRDVNRNYLKKGKNC